MKKLDNIATIIGTKKIGMVIDEWVPFCLIFNVLENIFRGRFQKGGTWDAEKTLYSGRVFGILSTLFMKRHTGQKERKRWKTWL